MILRNKLTAIFVLSVLALAPFAHVRAESGMEYKVENLLTSELQKRYPDTRIERKGALTLYSKEALKSMPVSLEVLHEDGKGGIRFQVSDRDGHVSQGDARVAVLANAFVAKRRLVPNEALTEDALSRQEVDLSLSQNREFRGLIVRADQKDFHPTRLQLRQTLLEGSPLLSSQVERIPDLKRGELVRVRLISGDIRLMTQATVIEPSYTDQPVRVLTTKNKRDLTGKLSEDGAVEVRL
jgi:flagella basal body P-ring formation protein FlgA